eukprot:jgi/Mesvir1/27241/Mv26377-RA.1
MAHANLGPTPRPDNAQDPNGSRNTTMGEDINRFLWNGLADWRVCHDLGMPAGARIALKLHLLITSTGNEDSIFCPLNEANEPYLYVWEPRGYKTQRPLDFWTDAQMHIDSLALNPLVTLNPETPTLHMAHVENGGPRRGIDLVKILLPGTYQPDDTGKIPDAAGRWLLTSKKQLFEGSSTPWPQYRPVRRKDQPTADTEPPGSPLHIPNAANGAELSLPENLEEGDEIGEHMDTEAPGQGTKRARPAATGVTHNTGLDIRGGAGRNGRGGRAHRD